LILDEPTTGLDSETATRVLEPLRRLMCGRTTLIVSHNLPAIREATTILVIKEGRVVERGSHADLVAKDGVYARLAGYHNGQEAAPTPTELMSEVVEPRRTGRNPRRLRSASGSKQRPPTTPPRHGSKRGMLKK